MKILRKIWHNLLHVSHVDVIYSVETKTGFTLEEIRSKSRDRALSAARKEMIKSLSSYSGLTVKQISECVNRSTQYIYNVLDQ